MHECMYAYKYGRVREVRSMEMDDEYAGWVCAMQDAWLYRRVLKAKR